VSNFTILRNIIGDKKTAEVVKRLSGKNIRIRTRLGYYKMTYVAHKKRFDKLSPKAVAKQIGCSWRYIKKLRSLLGGNNSQQKAS